MSRGKLLVFDPFAGAAGDMILGALLGLGVPLKHIEDELSKVDFGGYRLESSRVKRRGLSAEKFEVIIEDEHGGGGEREHGAPHHHESSESHQHHDHHHARRWADIRKMIEASGLSAGVKEKALRVFGLLAEAEAAAHDAPVEDVHFHEVGAVDSLVDIIGACAAVDYLAPGKIFCMPVGLGSGGTVASAHGILPIPAPATARLLEGKPVRVHPVDKELCTPTGAALLAGLADDFGEYEFRGRMLGTGVGAGSRDGAGSLPGIFRAMLLEMSGESLLNSQFIYELRFQVDDMTGEELGALFEVLPAAGALDVSCIPAMMKKNRPAHYLLVLCKQEKFEDVCRTVFRHSSTFGLRYGLVSRLTLERETRMVDTRFGKMRVKLGRLEGELLTASPEYEDCKAAAKKHGVSVSEAMDAVRAAWRE